MLRRQSMSVLDCHRLIHSLLRDYSISDSQDIDEEEDYPPSVYFLPFACLHFNKASGL